MKLSCVIILIVAAVCAKAKPKPWNGCYYAYVYDPVCGSDGNTYVNEGALECERLRNNPDLYVVFKGTCENGPHPPISAIE